MWRMVQSPGRRTGNLRGELDPRSTYRPLWLRSNHSGYGGSQGDPHLSRPGPPHRARTGSCPFWLASWHGFEYGVWTDRLSHGEWRFDHVGALQAGVQHRRYPQPLRRKVSSILSSKGGVMQAPYYSQRRATTGSTRIARYAGM